MRIAIASDHAGFDLKAELLSYLQTTDHEVQDLGTFSREPVDYPDYAQVLAEAVCSRTAERGILICGSGVGASVAANKIRGVRASVCHDFYSAHQGVEHDDMNVLCLGSRVIGPALARDLVTAFLGARFSDEERHRRRLNKVIALEDRA